MKLNDDLGFVYIEEQTSPQMNIANNMDVHDKNGVFFVSFESCLHSFDVMNRNNRMYKAANIDECLKTERIQSYLSHGGWFGEMNHPTSPYKDRPLSPERIQDIDMTNTSHKMLNPHIEGNCLVSKIETDSGTNAGMNLARKMVQGFIPGFSCRAIASMTLDGGKPTVNVRKIITYDWVLYQSHREAEQNTSAPTKFVSKIAKTVTEAAKDIENKSKDILIPLKEILESVGRTDVNTQVVMEAFDLNSDNMIGFDKGNRHVLIRDNNNIVYCGIDPKTREKVNDYFRSFK